MQRMLVGELRALGAVEVRLTPSGYVLATVPATSKKRRLPTVAFLAHVDTAPDFSGSRVKPIVHRKYDGGKIHFPDNPALVLDPAIDVELNEEYIRASDKIGLGEEEVLKLLRNGIEATFMSASRKSSAIAELESAIKAAAAGKRASASPFARAANVPGLVTTQSIAASATSIAAATAAGTAGRKIKAASATATLETSAPTPAQ